jgi:hypothetical protein
VNSIASIIERVEDWWLNQSEHGRRGVFYTAWFFVGFIMGAIAL